MRQKAGQELAERETPYSIEGPVPVHECVQYRPQARLQRFCAGEILSDRFVGMIHNKELEKWVVELKLRTAKSAIGPIVVGREVGTPLLDHLDQDRASAVAASCCNSFRRDRVS